jgi:aminodeoxyfutalosine synthase
MTTAENISGLLKKSKYKPSLQTIADKILNNERISVDEAVFLYEEGDLSFLGILANYVREKLHGNKTYFNRNFHIEPTNKCVFTCKFCSYSRLVQQEEDAWEYSHEQMLDIVRKYNDQPVTEVHIVGGVHPKLNLAFFCDVIRDIKKLRPDIHVKAFTAVELEYMFRKSKLSFKEGLQQLKDAGLNSMPGGGAEIFHEEIRSVICNDKATSEEWLGIHETAHQMGIPSNVTMLYGHIENYFHRADHMNRVRESQDRVGGFNCFIPLKFRNKDNEMSTVPEVSVIEDLKNYAVARIFMDNVPHLKAYWPMIGRSTAQLSLSFGVDDLDGTIDDSTKIYSMAGAEEQHPSLSTPQIVELIKQVGRHPVERDSLYHPLTDYSTAIFETEEKAARLYQ